jgi:CRISPR type I-E-associated protein CasB/Cse2
MTNDRQLYNDLRWACRKWWRDLNGVDSNGAQHRAHADRAARAALRRIGSDYGEQGSEIGLVHAFTIRRFHLLRSAVANAYKNNERQIREELLSERTALAAAVLARINDDLPDPDRDTKHPSTAKLLGRSREGSDEPLFAEARFRRLIRTDHAADLLPQMVRAIAILGRKAPVGELGASLLLWGPAVKKRWSFDYWRPGAAEDEGTDQAPTQNKILENA